MKIIGIGNAIIDILCEIDDDFLTESGLIKGSMQLIDEKMAEKFSQLKFTEITSGGSAGNTIATLSQLGLRASFIGKVGNDKFGNNFIAELEKIGAKFLNSEFSNKPSAVSFIFITPDAERTMCTFLGCAPEIKQDDILEKHIAGNKILYLEGYLWDKPETIIAIKKAIYLAKKCNVKIAFSLSDSFCVSRHKSDFLDLIKNDLDVIFANEAEALELGQNYQEIFAENKKLIAVVTKSENGCEVFAGKKIFSQLTQNITNLVDTTGAGDAFAAGFLYGFINEFPLEKSAQFGNILGGAIIQKFGARFDEIEIKSLTT